MQTNQVVRKFPKGAKQDLMEDKGQIAVLRKGRKFNKPKRGKGTYKSDFMNGKETQFKRDSSEGY